MPSVREPSSDDAVRCSRCQIIVYRGILCTGSISSSRRPTLLTPSVLYLEACRSENPGSGDQRESVEQTKDAARTWTKSENDLRFCIISASIACASSHLS